MCWHNWITVEQTNIRAAPWDKGGNDWVVSLGETIAGSCLLGLFVITPIVIGTAQVVSRGVPLNWATIAGWCVGLTGLLLVTSAAALTGIGWDQRDAGCSKCGRVWLGLTKSRHSEAVRSAKAAEDKARVAELVERRTKQWK